MWVHILYSNGSPVSGFPMVFGFSMVVVYFDQLLGAARTQKLVEIRNKWCSVLEQYSGNFVCISKGLVLECSG